MIELCEGEDTDEVYDIFYTQPYKRYTQYRFCAFLLLGKVVGELNMIFDG